MRPSPTLILAHRGHRTGGAADNTMAAFAAAAASGVDGIETDVRLSADGVPVLVHDRVTPRGRAVTDLTHSEIGADFGYPVPALAEAVAAFPGMVWNIEIKDARAVSAAVAVVLSYGSSRNFFITSFDHHLVRRVAQACSAPCGLLLAHRPIDVRTVMASCADLGTVRVLVWDFEAFDDTVAQGVCRGGWSNYVYGAVTPAEHERCMVPEIVGVITDYPEYALKARAIA
jgi:glycerophosphoryl diester phosphodiesterase